MQDCFHVVLYTVVLALVSILVVQPHLNFLQANVLVPQILLALAVESIVAESAVESISRIDSLFSMRSPPLRVWLYFKTKDLCFVVRTGKVVSIGVR